MVVVDPRANRIYQEYRQDFLKANDNAPRQWQQIAMEVPSRSSSTLHHWLGDNSVVREWLGPRRANQMATRVWEVKNRKFELTYEFLRDQLDDDLEGLTQAAVIKARSSGVKFARHEDLLIAATLEAGDSSLCWDGQYFFDTDHPVDVDDDASGTYSNNFGLALTHANFQTVLTAVRRFKNEDGSPMVPPEEIPQLVVPVELELTATQIVGTDLLTPSAAIALFGTSGPSKNPLVNKARPTVNNFLTDTTAWYLSFQDGPIKPLMLQRRRPLETSETGTNSDLYFNEEKFQIGGSGRYAASYTFPQLMVRSKP